MQLSSQRPVILILQHYAKTANKLQLANSNKTLEQVLKEKKSFQLYKDSLKILSKLTDEQAGRLLKAMVIFNNGEPVKLDEILSFVFFPFENQFIRDAEKYYITN